MDTYKDAVALNDLWASGRRRGGCEAPRARSRLRQLAQRRARNSAHRPADPAQAPLAGERPARRHRRADSRTSRSTSTLPGRAIEVMRLARLTGRPNQSPARGSASPSGGAGAQLREVLALGVGGVDQVERRLQQRLGLGRGEHRGVADRLDEPHRRLRRPRWRALPGAPRGGRARRAATSSPRRVKPTRSAKHTATSREPGSRPPLRSSALITSLCVAWRRCSASTLLTSGSTHRVQLRRRLARSAWRARARSCPARARASAAARAALSAAWESPRPSTRSSSRISSSEMPAARATCVIRADSSSASRVDGLVGLGDRQAHRAARRDEEVLVDAAAARRPRAAV